MDAIRAARQATAGGAPEPHPCVLGTRFGTLLCIDPESLALAHLPPERAAPNLCFVREGGGYRLVPGISVNAGWLARHGVAVREWAFAEQDGATTIRHGGLHAEALPTGGVRFRGGDPGPAAWFHPVPFTEAYRCFHRGPGRPGPGPGPGIPGPVPRGGIPPAIHQTYMHADPPEELLAAMAALRARNPGFSHRLWTDAEIPDFIRDAYGAEVLQAFLRINPRYGAARADLFRYLLLYREGGVYLDVKSGSRRPLAELIRPGDRFLLSQWNGGPGRRWQGWGVHPELRAVRGGEYQQWHVIAAAGHPFLERVIRTVLRNIARYHPVRFGVGRRGVLRVTGPVAYSWAIAEVAGLHPHRVIDAEAEGLEYQAVPDHQRFFATHYAALRDPVVL